ncbi:MAG: hypothetical protein AB1486_14190 [Planctomycetota bacterium]
MPTEPTIKRAVAFFDGQNLYHASREAFGYTFPNYDVKVVSAFPSSPTSRNIRGIDKTDWIPIERATYDACIDPRDYRSP